MNQFKPIFLGTIASSDDMAKLKRAVDSQKVTTSTLHMRTSNEDNPLTISCSVFVPVASTMYDRHPHTSIRLGNRKLTEFEQDLDDVGKDSYHHVCLTLLVSIWRNS